MRHFLLTGFAGILVFAATGCGGEGGEQASTPAPTSPAATPAPSPAQTATPTPGGKAPDFQPPMVPATPAKPPGLISSTPTGQRTKEVKTGRPNPFGGLPLPPVLKIEGEDNKTVAVRPPELGGAQVSKLPELPVAIGPSFPPAGQTGGLGGRQVGGLPGLPGGIGPALPPGGRAGTGIPPQGGRTVPSLPNLPDRIGPQRPNLPGGRGGQSPNLPGGRGGQSPNLPGGRGGQAGRQQPLPPPQPVVLEARAVPKLPDLPGSVGPQLPPGTQVRQGIQVPPLGNKGVPKLPEAPPGIGPNLPPAAKAGQGVQVPTLPSQGVPKLPELPVAIGPGVPPEPPAPAPSEQQPSGQQPNGQQPAAAPEPPPLPPVPQPDVALAVEVSGVVQVGNETQIIVKAPNEPTSRYVKVGQRLANGTVLVKRVELNGGSEPVVILEENGIEVAKAVGEKPVSPERPNPSATS